MPAIFHGNHLILGHSEVNGFLRTERAASDTLLGRAFIDLFFSAGFIVWALYWKMKEFTGNSFHSKWAKPLQRVDHQLNRNQLCDTGAKTVNAAGFNLFIEWENPFLHGNLGTLCLTQTEARSADWGVCVRSWHLDRAACWLHLLLRSSPPQKPENHWAKALIT